MIYKLIVGTLLTYIIYVFCYGIVVKVTMYNELLFNIKTYIPEILLFLSICLGLVCRKVKISLDTVILSVYLCFIALINIIIHGINEQCLYLTRDLYLPLFLFLLLRGLSFDDEAKEWFLKKIVTFCKAYLVVGFILAVLEQYMGWYWTSSFYTGYAFYGQDPLSKVRIAHNFGLLRVPSMSGNYATFGNYSVLAFCMVIFGGEDKKSIKEVILWSLISMGCIVLSTNKSALFAYSIINMYILRKYILIGNASLFSVLGYLIASLLIILSIALGMDATLNENSFLYSYYQRFDVWREIVNGVDAIEVIIPYNQFLYGSGAEGVFGFWDNTYIYLLFSIGIVGVLILSKIIYSLIKEQEKINRIAIPATIILLVLSLTTNITQGRAYLTIFLIIISLRLKTSIWNKGASI